MSKPKAAGKAAGAAGLSKFLLIWLVIYVGGLVLALVHPIYPMVSYLTFYYAPPRQNWWGRFLPDFRYSLLASAAILFSIVFKRADLERVEPVKNPALSWLLFFGLNSVVVTAWALDRARSWVWTVAFLKLILLYALIPAAVRTPAQFDTFGITHFAGATYWGYKAWDDPHRKAGRLTEVGGPDTQNDNLAAAHLLTVFPFAILYALTAKTKKARIASVIAGGFLVNCFVLCNSRGATLGLIAGGCSAIILAGKGRRTKLIGISLLGVLGLLWVADPEFIARQETTASPKDSSATGRLEMWKAGLRMVQDHPLGAGGRAFHILSAKYIPDILAKTNSEERSSHNTYIQLSTEWGVQGTVLYAGFAMMTFLTLHRIRRKGKRNDWYFYRSLGIQCGLIGTWTAGFFSNRLYGESIYWMCALAFALYRIQATELAAEQARDAIEVRTVPATDVPMLTPQGATR